MAHWGLRPPATVFGLPGRAEDAVAALLAHTADLIRLGAVFPFFEAGLVGSQTDGRLVAAGIDATFHYYANFWCNSCCTVLVRSADCDLRCF